MLGMRTLAPRNGDRSALRSAAVVVPGLASLTGIGTVSAATASLRALLIGCSGTSRITCHYAVSPGNYDVTVSIGRDASGGRTAMCIQSRRLVPGTTRTVSGTVARYSSTIDVRQPQGEPTGEGGTGTPGLDVRLTGSAPRVSAVSHPPDAHLR